MPSTAWCLLLALLPCVTSLWPCGGSNAKATDSMVAEAGYPVETHTVATADGYLLMVHRIPGGREGRGDKVRPVVFLQHGLMTSSADWVRDIIIR